MLHLHLHLRHGDDYIEDSEGEDYESLDAARADAVFAARELMSERLRRGAPLDGSQFEIADGEGRILAVLPFHEALPAE